MHLSRTGMLYVGTITTLQTTILMCQRRPCLSVSTMTVLVIGTTGVLVTSRIASISISVSTARGGTQQFIADVCLAILPPTLLLKLPPHLGKENDTLQ